MRTPEQLRSPYIADTATVAFVDLAGFSAITDVYGDEQAIAIIEVFEGVVAEALAGSRQVIKWIGDEAMFAFSEPAEALETVGRLLSACKDEPKLPLTRCGMSHGRVVRRGNDLFGSTVNIAARVTALAAPGQLLATNAVAEVAKRKEIVVSELGAIALRSVVSHVPLYSIELTPAPDASWIDPVCKMHPPFSGFRRVPRATPWFCSEECAEAYRRSPSTYAIREH
jgi:adenylate cyclase